MQTFQPDFSQFYSTIIWAIIFLILLAIIYFWINKKSTIDAKRRQMLTFMLGLLSFIGIGTLLFMILSMTKVVPVEVSLASIKTPYGEARYENIEKITFHDEGLNNKTQRILIIQEKNGGQLHTLSERMYPIDSIFAAVKRIVGE